ncbi:MAG: hypothetical protein JXR52_10640 [Bacteroidales bacterium]|nr:hypothetical protein [Bacteroidales bacterium]
MRSYHWITLTIVLAILFWYVYRTGDADPRIEKNIDLNWKFTDSDTVNAFKPEFNDSEWKFVTLPHDWMIEQKVEKNTPSGKAGGFYPPGIGWYRKSLDLSHYKDKNQFYILFEGVYMNADVYFNGAYLGKQINGYTSFYHDVSELVRKDTINIIAVRTDCSKLPVDRWYSGGGLYRHVKLIATDRIHVPVWSYHIHSEIENSGSAELQMAIDVFNNSNRQDRFNVICEIISPAGKVVARGKQSASLKPGEINSVEQTFVIKEPDLWSPDEPCLYKIKCSLKKNGTLHDRIELNHGIRSIVFDPQKGLVVNGNKVIMKGVCLHHDGGELGSAITEAGWERRFKILKQLGVNSIRFAHNPHAPGVLDLCDRMGFLVVNEMYDKWEMAWNDAGPVVQFADTWKKDLENFIKRDRNHPSVVLWSVGNEVTEQRFDPEKGRQWYKSLIELTRSLDPFREVTCAMHPGYAEQGDEIPSSMIHLSNIVAYNYRTKYFAEWQKDFPDKVFIASETMPYRSEKPEDYHNISFQTNSWFYLPENSAGQFIWAGIDYLGESMDWPDRGFKHGILKTNGFLKPISYFVKSIYSEEPMVKITVLDSLCADSLNNLDHWQVKWTSPPLVDHWTFEDIGSMKNLVIFTNCDGVELSLNDQVIDTLYKKSFSDGVIQKKIPFEPGILSAKAFRYTKNEGKDIAGDTLITAGEPYAIRMDPDKYAVKADGTDMIHITTKIVDSIGILTPRSNHLVNYVLEGPGQLRVIDNGDLSDLTRYGLFSKEVRNGNHLVIIRAGNEPGDLIISANAEGLNPAVVKIVSE